MGWQSKRADSSIKRDSDFCASSTTLVQVTAVSLLIHAATELCSMILNAQISAVLATCVHQQSSIDLRSRSFSTDHKILTTRTVSPYLSSKNALAPVSFASSIVISWVLTSSHCLIHVLIDDSSI